MSVAVKKGAILAPLAPGGPLPSRMSLSLLLGGVVQNGPERSRARRYWARRSGPLTARTVLGDWGKRERLSEELAKGGPKKWPLCPAPLTVFGSHNFGIPSLHAPLPNASSAPFVFATPSHGSRSGWFATPFLYDSFIHYSTPVYPDAIQAKGLLHRAG